MCMSDRHAKALVRYRVDLVKNLIIDEELLSHMMAKNEILTDHMKDEIQSKNTQGDRIGKLLDILRRRGPDAMSTFIFALVHTSQEHLARLLDEEIANKFIEELRQETNQALSEEVDSGPSEEFEKTLEEKLSDIQAGNANLLVTVQRLDISGKTVGDLCKRMDRGEVYNVRSSKRGRVVIFSWHYFVSSKLEKRDGNEKDVENLKELFGKHLQFNVEVCESLTEKEFYDQVDKERLSEELNNTDMFILIVLSHGNDGCFYECNGKSIRIDDVVNKFDGNSCPFLSGKPKLFFIQACQGEGITMGAAPHKPSEGGGREEESFDHVDAVDPNPLPSSSVVRSGLQEKNDYLVGKASVSVFHKRSGVRECENRDGIMDWKNIDDDDDEKGFQASRHKELGTLYIRCIVYVFSRKAHKDHVEDMLTEVANIMSAYKTAKNEVFCSKKEGTLRKKLYFMPVFNSQ